MNVKLLIDGIARQTTVLIAQLSTNAGVRAPLAHLADQVFLSLAREIEAQGVGRKVVADMFGVALRTYQRKTQRLATSVTTQGKTLFEAILEFVETHGLISRRQILQRFEKDGERETIGVLTDLVQSGLLHATGNGDGTIYGVTTDAERQHLTRHSDAAALSNVALGEIYRLPGVRTEALAQALGVDVMALSEALAPLFADGRVARDPDGALRAATFQIPVGSSVGWEGAIMDHFQAVATTIASKLRLVGSGRAAQDKIGGTTLRFELHAEHPLLEEVLGLLSRVRNETDALWLRVARYNDEQGAPVEKRASAVFYFGLNVDDLTLVDPEWREV
jgi:hypothetical protein